MSATRIQSPPAPRRAAARRRGVASVLAMLFLVLFAVLSVGFFASTTLSVQTSRNERQVGEAQAAAESAMQWYRRQYVRLNFSPAADPATTFTNLYNALGTQLNGTSNLGGQNITRGLDAAGNDILYIPGTTGSGASLSYGWMALGGTAGQARVTITRSNSNLLVKAVGVATGASPPIRAVQFTYAASAAGWTLPGAGLLTKSPVSLSNGAQISGGDVTTTTTQNVAPLTMSGGAKIDRNFAYTTNSRAPSISNGAQVVGQIIPNITPPTFPQVDPTIFEAFVPAKTAAQGPKVITSTSTIAATATLTNIRIKANANTSFGNSVTLNGVIYIESPNQVSFGGGSRVNGIIVTDNDRTKPLAGNTITINNGVRVDGVETLDPAAFAASENIAQLRTLSGALILAPNYKVTLAGGSRTYNDSMVASQFDISNGYRGSIGGALINLDDTNFTMMGGGLITFTAGSTSIAGLTGGQRLAIDLGTYAEVDP